ncbi:TetR/AcrR family transcriptional regulator [Fodinicola acaciae]|uniref:TetR/AcrR family transcriptional regulator n=1 Tax=Fodinicola acaciae TaxID=2681555 RepID=UPI0013CFD9B4|nr:TetR/AcrR family transcriptional regulator [Fodinicola acaciae]
MLSVDERCQPPVGGAESVVPAPRGSADAGQVLDAAMDTFLDFGIKRATMTEIARRAGVGVATVYRRFPQKGGLVQATVTREVQRFIADVDSKIAHASTPVEEVVECFVAFVVGAREHPLLRRILDTEPEIVLPALTIAGGPVIALGREYVAQKIRRLRGSPIANADDVDMVAEMFARLAQSMVLTPDGRIPSGDDEKTREFARRHIAPLVVSAK